MCGFKKWRPVKAKPLNNSRRKKLETKLLSEKVAVLMRSAPYFQMFQGDMIQPPTSTNHTRVIGMKIFQPRRMIWS